jgi:hypothetical protein
MYNQNLAPTTVQRTIRIPSGCLLFARANREFDVVRFLPTELALAEFIKAHTVLTFVPSPICWTESESVMA